jgi:hypothetical protein
MEEIWRPIPDFPGYEASDLGNIKSYHCDGNGYRTFLSDAHPIKVGYTKFGYAYITLVKDTVHFSRLVHQLVLETFVGKRPTGYQACHNNGIPSDNRIVNLRWDTTKQNMNDREKHGKTSKGEQINTNKLKANDVLEIRKKYNQGISPQIISGEFHIHLRTVYKIAKKECWKWL